MADTPARSPGPDALPPLAEHFMRRALAQAHHAGDEGEIPVGAVIVRGTEILGQAHNQVELLKDPTAHAEILAITQAAAALGDWRLLDCTLFVTKEPCPMCAGAIVLARIPLVCWGADDPLRGGGSVFNLFDHPNLNHRVTIQRGLLGDEARALLQDFFRARRTAPDPVQANAATQNFIC